VKPEGNEMTEKRIFAPVSEKDVSRAIVSEFAATFEEFVESDVVIVGAGPSGLMAARALADAGRRVVIIERNNYLGGGFWIGGYLMNKITARAPSQLEFAELGIPFKEASPGFWPRALCRGRATRVFQAHSGGLRRRGQNTQHDRF
jgi:ribulose 1,5-bisphosphate synthetase/thiazole synthase